uniref:Uncharacterized protein n=1 Tax=Anguilla anguilla TaxID=7936 RepID=A0A0E9VUM4_ANGAN
MIFRVTDIFCLFLFCRHFGSYKCQSIKLF